MRFNQKCSRLYHGNKMMIWLLVIITESDIQKSEFSACWLKENCPSPSTTDPGEQFAKMLLRQLWKFSYCVTFKGFTERSSFYLLHTTYSRKSVPSYLQCPMGASCWWRIWTLTLRSTRWLSSKDNFLFQNLSSPRTALSGWTIRLRSESVLGAGGWDFYRSFASLKKLYVFPDVKFVKCFAPVRFPDLSRKTCKLWFFFELWQIPWLCVSSNISFA